MPQRSNSPDGLWCAKGRMLAVVLVFLTNALPAAFGDKPVPGTATHEDGLKGEEALCAEERSRIEVFKRASPGVVSVANKAIVQDFFTARIYEVPQGVGSGFVWDKQGHLVSNFHVVYRASAIRVTLHDGSVYEAEVVGADPDHDIVVLRINAPPERLTPLPLASSRNLQVGQTVLAIGNPFGFDTSLSMGVVSALGRNIQSMTGRTIYDVIQTDAAINPGNSGGPLLNSSGRVIGMNTAIVSPSGAYAGVGFAVPVDVIRRIVPQLIARGVAQQAGLGLQLVHPIVAQRLGVEEGLVVLRTQPRGPADRAGLQGLRKNRRGQIEMGDILLEAAGRRLRTADDLMAVLDQCQAGEWVELLIRRGSTLRTVQVQLLELSDVSLY